ncbi:hypothetical protein CTI12_AA249500 [Artemisia annua]|uniref:Uncharacterized protein n=1 Tax=Artemisia annua TaxID=35608 RepID=A0A2U1NMJ5_ARTAN|nr:hypothetical protein CTI12_AA249500 [Artemisia annua]
MFRKNIRAYNTYFSFASMGVKLDKTYNVRNSGVYTFRAHGEIYHRIDQLIPRNGQPRLQWPNLDKKIVKILSRVLAPNPYVQTFRTLGNLGPLDKYMVELYAYVKVDRKFYNHPTTSEICDDGIKCRVGKNYTIRGNRRHKVTTKLCNVVTPLA